MVLGITYSRTKEASDERILFKGGSKLQLCDILVTSWHVNPQAFEQLVV